MHRKGTYFSFILPYLFKKVNENKKIRESETTRAGVAFSAKAQRKKKCEKNLKIIEKNIENILLFGKMFVHLRAKKPKWVERN